ncbi:MAG: response regulator transcription factor [Ramlibacter sp.]|nr:response regulator transcription factor [Ramlibacter sp.]MBX3658680.1 response regulator transcription factor [Ramlibacter sp.]MCW5649687.1 response regulator transcription factor [Ramlibacter sp.]
MTLKLLVVDDEALARSRLCTLLGDCRTPAVHVAGEAANAAQAMELIQHQRFDAVLLDIHMPGADGMTLASALRALPRPPAIIFVTAHPEHAVQAFEIDVADYLTKPVRLERLQLALQKAERLVAAGQGPEPDLVQESLLIQDRGRTERVPLAEVLYFKAELKYITVRTLARSYILDGSLNELESRHGDQFIRVHRNAMVARRAMRALEKHHDPEEGDGWAVRLAGVDEVLAVSRRQVAAVREAIAG